MKVRVTDGKKVRYIDEELVSRAIKYGFTLVEDVEEPQTETISEEEEN